MKTVKLLVVAVLGATIVSCSDIGKPTSPLRKMISKEDSLRYYQKFDSIYKTNPQYYDSVLNIINNMHNRK